MCGASDAFDRPRFVEAVSHSEHYDVPGDTDWHIPEHLDWPCSTCGYVVETDTLEQRTAKSRGAA